ncbi:Similar to cN-IIIB: 7-methylguanosine phosphate-specific 5'-nucleotidase (Drosophila melanogaster) [Cotesia congregata]|uniref:5'-nucleotidase n=1 Tax=Cotesia congregata TaxID=51543 RepID=A0A8J2H6B2_COTCN|nr:Similar to cN-IIIB: 7-methylguanosine phosphate-specific 5'-nucleotidase (Drosophila melanogaster) [Cotesia congregata]
MPDDLRFEDMSILKNDNVRIRDLESVINKIKTIRDDGPTKLQMVTDFDRTITKQHVNGQHILSSFGIFFESSQISEKMKEEKQRLFDKYRPIELDHDLELEKKIEAMESWMTESDDLLRGVNYDPCEIEEVVKIHGTDVRDRTKELIDRLNAAKVPVLVFSAGLGDVVEAILKLHDVFLNNVKVVSNFLNYKDGKINGFKNDQLIHVFNKNENVITDKEYYNSLKGRKNVVLMGDMTGDATMADGAEGVETILKIGFLYEQVESSLPSFLDTFDIVLIDDQSMDIVIDILRPII